MRWLVAFSVVGCTSTKDMPTIDTGDETLTTDRTTTTTTTVSGTGELSGYVLAEDGRPIEEADIRFCLASGSCRTDKTDAKGVYSFDDVDAVWHSLEVVPPNEGPFAGRVVAFAPVVFEDGEVRTIDMPLLPPGGSRLLPATAAELEVATGLFVTVAADDLEPPAFAEPATEMHAVSVPADRQPPIDGVAGTVVAMWFMGPFDHHAAEGLPVRIANDFELPVDAIYEVWVGSYGDAMWVPAGSLTVTEDGLVGDAKLPVVSTVILVDPA